MNSAIFISYSRQDEKQAMHLLSLLRREGYTVWIDQESIAGASIWSDEIVHNIKESGIFIALLSESSAASHNVSKEIAIAAEHGKIILPIEIGTVNLPGRLEYALAGIQRTNYHDEQAILHAVRNLVAKLSGEEQENVSMLAPHSRMQRVRKRALVGAGIVLAFGTGLFFLLRDSKEKISHDTMVAVLPFRTLNLEKDSTRNLDIFSEAIQTTLSKHNVLTLISGASSSTYKNSDLNAIAIGNKLQARFIVEGIVRKAHDVNYVAVRVFDSKRGGEIWEEVYSGNAKELFNIREKLCSDIVGAIVGVVNDEQNIRTLEQNVAAHPGDAAAIARLANDLISTDKSRSLNLFEQAIKLDSTNVGYLILAGIVASRLSDADRSRECGALAVGLCRRQLQLHPDSLNLATNYALALDMAGQNAYAGKVFDSLLHIHPTDIRLLYNAACCYAKQGKSEESLNDLEVLFPIAPGKKGEVQSDPDFDNIRSNPRYARLMNPVAR
ncbi:MAG: TIR domain-containing protein [Bacteroidota bacterium]|nr:TIR domain-containing protein [Bacteroidota bacterium]